MLEDLLVLAASSLLQQLDFFLLTGLLQFDLIQLDLLLELVDPVVGLVHLSVSLLHRLLKSTVLLL